MALKGSCLCGAVGYEIDGELGKAMICHCGICRKSNGSAFAVNAPLAATTFRLVQGENSLGCYASSEDAQRYFCKNCGSPIYSARLSLPEMIRLRVGALDRDVPIEKGCHVYVASKAAWDDINDVLPQFSQLPASF